MANPWARRCSDWERQNTLYASKASLLITLTTTIYSSLTSTQNFPLRSPCPCSLSNIVFLLIKSLLTSSCTRVVRRDVFTSCSCCEFLSPTVSTIPGPGGLWCCPTQLLLLSDLLHFPPFCSTIIICFIDLLINLRIHWIKPGTIYSTINNSILNTNIPFLLKFLTHSVIPPVSKKAFKPISSIDYF